MKVSVEKQMLSDAEAIILVGVILSIAWFVLT